MRGESGHIYDLWSAGGPFIGSNGKPHTRVTVEVGWTLGHWDTAVGSFKKPPLRWFQRADNTQVETEIPNVSDVAIDRSIDQDAATAVISLMNQKLNAFDLPNINPDEFGNPGWLTFSRGSSAASAALWGHTPNEWENVLVPNALIRTYQGYGGTSKTMSEALVDGNIILTGVWLVDEVRITTGGKLELHCRDMAKLLIEQILYPPLVPIYDVNGCDVYPLRYQRYFTIHGTQSGKIPYGSDSDNPNGRRIYGIEYAEGASPCVPDGEGYWLAGDDGGVFTYGFVNFYGSRHNPGELLNQPIRGMTATKSNLGYWLLGGDGGIFSFGDAVFHGSGVDVSVFTDAVALERSAAGDGYFIARADGSVYAFGDAVYNGNAMGIAVGAVVGMDVRRETPGLSGYWLCTNEGYVYAFGDAGYHGGINGGYNDVVGFACTPTGNGYYLVRADGAVYTFGDAVYRGGANSITLNDPITDIAVHPSGKGYWLGAEDGGVFTFGEGMVFYGSLPGPWTNLRTIDGNYFDYTDIVKDLLIWSGFWLNDGGISPLPFGNFESTGIYNNTSDGALPDSIFDMQKPIDAINKLKAVVGYIFWVDERGAARFESPNWWSPGNFLETGEHTNTIPEVHEALQLTNYGISHNDASMVSKIVIASRQPNPDSSFYAGTVLTDYTPVNADDLRGITKQFMWTNELFIKPEEQQVMAELIDMQINFQNRLGSVTCPGNPLLQINDQIRILERETSETYVHYIRGISSHHDLVSGAYTMTITTNWLGDTGAWAIFVPSVVVHPDTVATAVVFPDLHLPQTVWPAVVATSVVVPEYGANDSWGDAQLLVGNFGSVSGNNVDASMEVDEPEATFGSGTHTVWWRWVASVDGQASFSTAGSVFDTVLDVWTGSSLATLTLVGNDDDAGPGTTSYLTVTTVAATEYFIRVNGYDDTEVGDIVLSWAERLAVNAVTMAVTIPAPTVSGGVAVTPSVISLVVVIPAPTVSGSGTTCTPSVVSMAVTIPAPTSIGSSYSAVVLADSPVGYWPLDETSGTVAADQSGNGFDATYTGTYTLGASGLFTSCLDVSGSGSAEIAATVPAGMQLSTGSVEIWCRSTGFGSTAGTVLIYLPYSYNLLQKNGGPGTLEGSSNYGSWDYQAGSPTLADDTARHVVLTFDSGVSNGTKIYVDGSLVATFTWTAGSMTDGASKFVIGGGSTGKFAQAALYDYVLTPTQVADHNTAGRT